MNMVGIRTAKEVPMTYKEWLAQREKEVNELPVFYAFNDEQFAEGMASLGLTADDTDKIYKLGNTGGFYRRVDAPIIHAFLDKEDELPELMEKEPGFAEEAFYYEMANHEYHINWQADWDVCNCFGGCEYGEDKGYVSYLKEMEYSENVILAYRKARKKFLREADEKGWY